MQVTYIDKLFLQTDRQETEFIMNQRRTCYNGIYPYKIFPQKRLREISFGADYHSLWWQWFGKDYAAQYHSGKNQSDQALGAVLQKYL